MNDPVPFGSFDWQIEFDLSHEAVLEVWFDLVRCVAPWRTMACDDVLGYLRPILITVLGAERDPDERRRVAALYGAAARHAAFRRGQRCDRRLLESELLALRAAIRITLERTGADPAQIGELAQIADAELRHVRRVIRRERRG